MTLFQILMRPEFFLKVNKRADQNKAVQGEFFLKINKCACTSIRYTRVADAISTFFGHLSLYLIFWYALLLSKMICNDFDDFFAGILNTYIFYHTDNWFLSLKDWPRDIHIECSKQFKWNLYIYVLGQSRPFWAVLKLL